MPSSPAESDGAFVGPIRVSVESGLESPGDTITVTDTIKTDPFEMGKRTFTFDDGATYDVALTNTGEGILATGIARGTVNTTCDRCLAPVTLDVAGEISCYYLKQDAYDELTDEDDDEFGLIEDADGTIDLSCAIQGALVTDIPFVILCRPDCKGLCPVCGADLNEGDCGCVIEPDPDFEKPNPFAALANFTFADGTVLADHLDELNGATDLTAEEQDSVYAADGSYVEDDDFFDEDDEDDLTDEEFEAAWEELHPSSEDDLDFEI